jgi:hypothetical protein
MIALERREPALIANRLNPEVELFIPQCGMRIISKLGASAGNKMTGNSVFLLEPEVAGCCIVSARALIPFRLPALTVTTRPGTGIPQRIR